MNRTIAQYSSVHDHADSSSTPRFGVFGSCRVHAAFGYLGYLLQQLSPVEAAALSGPAASVALSGPDRSLTTALQNVNGMSSVLALVPVLTGKVQNIKMIAARTFPASLVIADVGGGRVLTKVQISMLLISSSLYHNLVDELSYYHDEYVNKFSSEMIHIPTGTPERHASNVIINHNPSEAYLVEAWFQTQGQPAKVSLKQNSVRRMLYGLLIYMNIRAGEGLIEIQNVATGAWFALLAIQIISSFCWVVALILLQINRGQSSPTMLLNRLSDPDYRCLQVVGLGHHVATALFSFNLECLTTCHMFGGNYNNHTLLTVGGLVLVSAGADLVSTVLIVSLTTCAYPWLGMEVVIVMVKVAFSLEPLRQLETKRIEPIAGQSGPLPPRKKDIELPLTVNMAARWQFTKICVGYNVVKGAGKEWVSLDPGIWIGQPYHFMTKTKGDIETETRYLAKDGARLILSEHKLKGESNQALQREYLSCLGEIVKANKVPSWEFVEAVELTVKGMQEGMTAEWFKFGTKDIMVSLESAKTTILWRSLA